jgi:hypothetical protein
MRTKKSLVLIAALGFFLLAAGAASAQSSQSNLTVTYPAGFAVSTPLSQIGQSAIATALPNVQTIIPLRIVHMESAAGAGVFAPNQPDPALQTALGAPLELENEGRKPRFPGVGANGSAPGDPNLAVGPNHIVQIVNTEYAVYDKSGNIFPGYPKTLGSIFNALGNSCTGEWGDPIAQYDNAADRWLLSQLGTFNTPGIECIAVSQTNDPTGAYYLYSFIPDSSSFNDYPKISVWPTATNSAYFATYNLFQGNTGVGAELCAYDRAAMLSGAASPAQICFTIANDFSYLPSDLDGLTLPPSGSPGYFLNFQTPPVRPLSTLRLYRLAPNFANPGGSTLSAPMDITVASFYPACAGIVCIPQPGTTQQLDSLGDRLMYRLAYRNFGDHDALVVNHSVATSTGTGVRWYELRSPLTGAFTLYQQGTFGPDATSRWMGSAAMDRAGDIAIGYSASSSSVFPGLRYTGRIPTDALGMMRTESVMFNGSGSQTGGLSRWGDYSALRVDPSDDCTFWYTNQYEPTSGSFNWATSVGSFKFTNCGTPAQDFSVAASPASQAVVQGNPTSYTATVTPSGGFTGSVTVSVSGLPSGANATFSPNPITSGSGNSTVNVTTGTSTPAGSYALTITGTSGSLTHSATVTLVVTSAGSANFSISGSPSSQTVTAGNQTSYTASVTPSGGFTGSVTVSVSGLPSGANAMFSPNPITGGSWSSTVSVTTSSTTATGSYTLTIKGTSGSLNRSTTVTLVVTSAGSANFSISASPSSQTVTAGNRTSYTATVTPSGGFTGNVNMSASGLPSGANATFSPNSIAGGSGNSTMSVTTSTNTPTGTYTLTITGTSGSLTHSTTVALVVNGFSISVSPSSRTVTRGNSTTYTVTVTSINGFTGGVTFSARGLPSGSSAGFNPSSVTAHGTSTVTVSTTSSTSTGTFNLRIRGSSGGVTHSTTVQLVVQ